MILRDDDTEYALEHVSNYFQSGVPAQGIVYRDGNTVGVFERTWTGHLKIFSRDIRHDFWDTRKFKLESTDPYGRTVAYSDFYRLIEKLFQEAQEFAFEFLHNRSGRWIPISRQEVMTLVKRATVQARDLERRRADMWSKLERGEGVKVGDLVIQKRISGAHDTYDVTYPGQGPQKNITRDQLFSQLPELKTLFKHFGITVMRELTFETETGTIRVEGHNWQRS